MSAKEKYDPAEDAELARAAQQGDQAAFEQIVAKYHRLVFKIAYRKASHPTDAEDLTQEVFLHAFRSLPNLREPQAFLGWLMAIAHNRCNRFCRTRQAKIIALEEARKELQASSHPARKKLLETTPNEAAPEDADVSELVQSLPEEFRWALTWKYLEGCSYDEIGERLSMSFNQVDYLLRRAKNELRALVERAASRAQLGRQREGGRQRREEGRG